MVGAYIGYALHNIYRLALNLATSDLDDVIGCLIPMFFIAKIILRQQQRLWPSLDWT